MGSWPTVAATFCACALLAGCGTHQQRKTAPASQSACINAKQLATLQREIRNVTIPGDKDFAFRAVEVWGGCGSKHTVHASIAQRTSEGEYEHITINPAGRITSTGHPFVPGP